jgi:hypothetical protein
MVISPAPIPQANVSNSRLMARCYRMRQVTGIASLIAAVVAARLAVMMFFDLYPNRMLHFALLAGFLLIGGIYAFSRPRAALNTYLVGGVVMLAVTIGQLYSLTWGYRYTPRPDPAVVRGWLDLYWPWIAVLFGLALLSYRTWRQEQASGE